MLTKTMVTFGAAVSLCAAISLAPPAGAQTTPPQPPTQGAAPAPSGTTSGPASGSPATMGTTGSTPGTPHQNEAIRDPSSAVKPQGGQGDTQGSGSVGTQQPGSPDTQSGATPKQ
jgi:hypothetical protein